jgi:hypothetical protein
MPDDQAETVGLRDKERLAKRIKFEHLYRDYLSAQTAYADPDGPDDDEVKDPPSDKRMLRNWHYCCRPPRRRGIWVKWEILDRLVATDA